MGLDKRLGVAALRKAYQMRQRGALPFLEKGRDGLIEGGKLGVAQDGDFEFGLRNAEGEVAGT